MPKVSVCVPVYKVEKYIAHGASSLFEQTLDDVEYIFVSDASPDDSIGILRKVVEHYPNRKPFVRIIELDRNQGPGEARRVAASYATGDFIYFMDADDWVDRDMLETMYHKAVSENADMVICTFDIVTSNGIEKYDFTLFESNEEWLDYLITRNRKCHTTAGLHTRVFSRDLYQKVKNLCDFTGLIRYEDFLLVIALHYYSSHVFVLQKSFYHYNKVNENSITKVQNDYTVLCIIRAGDYLQKFLEGVQLYEHYKGSVGKFRANGYNQYLLKWELWDPKKWAYWHDKYSNDSKPEGFTLKYRTFLSLIRILVACSMEGVAKKLVRSYGLK